MASRGLQTAPLLNTSSRRRIPFPLTKEPRTESQWLGEITWSSLSQSLARGAVARGAVATVIGQAWASCGVGAVKVTLWIGKRAVPQRKILLPNGGKDADQARTINKHLTPPVGFVLLLPQ